MLKDMKVLQLKGTSPTFKTGQVLELIDNVDPQAPGFTDGKTYVKILGVLWETCEYHIKLYDKNMKVITGSSHRVSYLFIDLCFKVEVALTMKSIYNLRKKR